MTLNTHLYIQSSGEMPEAQLIKRLRKRSPLRTTTWRSVVSRYHQAPEEVRNYFEGIPDLMKSMFGKFRSGSCSYGLEKAMNRMLYCGAVKKHKADSKTASRMVDGHHMTRGEFRRLFKNVSGIAIPQTLIQTLADAEQVRDRVVHGKKVSDADMRRAIVRLLTYAEGMNELVNANAGFKPFTNDLRGFPGARRPLDSATTYWLMKGLGFESRGGNDANAL